MSDNIGPLQQKLISLSKNGQKPSALDQGYAVAADNYTRGAIQDAYDGLQQLIKAQPDAMNDDRVKLLLRRCEIALNLR